MGNPRNGFRREARFRRIMAKRGTALTRPGRVFRFAYSMYRPDFHDPATETFYEVIGSRQRRFSLLPTLDLMRVVYPKVKLVIVTPDGSPVEFKGVKRMLGINRLSFGRRLQARMAAEGLRWRDVERITGISKGTLSSAIHGRRPAVETLKKLKIFAQGGTQ